MEARQAVRFYLNGALQEVVPSSPTQTVLQYLRQERGLTGTKEGCSEGDCGACTVSEASLDANDQLAFRSVNACIRFLPTLDGRAIWTVEAIADKKGALHPVQQSMVDHHGSQCGFCTPGFVMSLYTMYQNGLVQPQREDVLDYLSGNLCRCTGYRPIIDAALHLGEYPEARLDLQQVRQQLLELRNTRAGSLRVSNGTQSYFAPTTVDELAALYLQYPDAVLLAGGTDVGLWVTKQLRNLETVIYLGDVTELATMAHDEDGLRIGANVLLNDGYEAIVQEYPEATELWKRFASMPIRNSGTLVGNLANGSPIGDSAPLLIAIQSRVVLRKGNERRELPLEDLYLDYRKQDRQAGEFIEAVLVPRRSPNTHIATYKLSKRMDQDISAVCSAYAVQLEDDRVVSARIAHGGMAATSRRATQAEQALLGRKWDETAIADAMDALSRDYEPLTDMRASNAYRLKGARNLLYRFYLQSTGVAETRI